MAIALLSVLSEPFLCHSAIQTIPSVFWIAMESPGWALHAQTFAQFQYCSSDFQSDLHNTNPVGAGFLSPTLYPHLYAYQLSTTLPYIIIIIITLVPLLYFLFF